MTCVGKVELDVTGIAHGGISVARLDGRVVFVSDAMPGETVVARITDDRKKSFWRADTVSVVEASEHRPTTSGRRPASSATLPSAPAEPSSATSRSPTSAS